LTGQELTADQIVQATAEVLAENVTVNGDITEEYDADVSQSQPTQNQAEVLQAQLQQDQPKPLSRRAKKALKSARKSTLSPVISEEAEPSQSVASSRQSTPNLIEEAVSIPTPADETVDQAAVSMQVDNEDVFGPATKAIAKGRRGKTRKEKRALKRPLGESESELYLYMLCTNAHSQVCLSLRDPASRNNQRQLKPNPRTLFPLRLQLSQLLLNATKSQKTVSRSTCPRLVLLPMRGDLNVVPVSRVFQANFSIYRHHRPLPKNLEAIEARHLCLTRLESGWRAFHPSSARLCPYIRPPNR
jgi:hypothetical protein